MINTNNFILEVEEIKKTKEISYIDSICFWCEKNGIEVEVVSHWIKKDPVLKSKIQLEAEELNFIKRTSPKLPFS